MDITKERIVGQMVAEDYRYAAVFKSNGIDFCCNGNRSLDEVCANKNVELGDLIKELADVSQSTEGKENANFNDWDLDLLVDYIEKKHHRFVTKKIAEIIPYLEKIAQVHGGNHPELIEIHQLFIASAQELLSHMKKEELILFPYVRQQVEFQNTTGSMQTPHFGTIQNPIRVMMNEHDNEGQRFRIISELSNNYTPPKDACATYQVAFALLNEFEEDLHKHIHLENNILFPRSIELESQLNYA